MSIDRTLARLWRELGAVILALLVLATGADAQGRGRGPGGGMGGGPALLRDSLPAEGPIAILLARRDSLSLSPQQVSALQAIDRDLQQENAPRVRELLALRREIQPLIGMHPRDMTPAQRTQFAAQVERARPLMEQLRANNLRAMDRVGELLSPEQKQRVRRWLQGARIPGAGALDL